VYSENIDKLKNGWKTQVEVQMNQNLRFKLKDLMSCNLIGGVKLCEKLNLGDRYFLVFSSHEQRSYCLQRVVKSLKLRSKGYPMVDAEGQKDSFHLEPISQAKSKNELQAAHSILLSKILTIEEERHGKPLLLTKEVLADGGHIDPCISNLNIVA
jgi:hypothetical protein